MADDKKLRITGRVIDSKTNTGVPALRIEACDKDSIVKEPFITEVTDQQGSFTFEFKKGRLKDFFGERQPRLFFKVFRDNARLANTKDSLVWTPDSLDQEIVIQVQPPEAPTEPPKPPNPLKIKGQIRRADGAPVGKATVRVFLSTQQGEVPVGEAQTDSAGNYQISSSDQSLANPPANALLEARVFDKAGRQIGALSSPLQQRSTTIDVVVESIPEPGEEQCLVWGQVLQPNGKTLSSGIVRIHGVKPPGGALKDAAATIIEADEGKFRIEYQPGKKYSVRLDETSRIEVRVFRVVNNQEQELVQSSPPVAFRADPEQFLIINLRNNVDEPPVLTETFTVHGRITRGGQALVNESLNVSAFDGNLPLGRGTQSDFKGEYSITYKVGPPPNNDIATAPANLKVTVIEGTIPFSVALAGTVTGDDEINVDLPVKPSGPGDSTVEGVIFLDYGLAAKNIAVRVYHRGFGTLQELLRQTTTSGTGAFKTDYDSAGRTINLEVRVLDPGNTEVPISAIKYNASKREVFKLIAPASVQPLVPSEYDRLIADVTPQLPAGGRLGAAREDATSRDLTMLHGAIKWDARFISMAALADKLTSETGIGREALYGVFRAGLPTGAQLLATLDVSVVENALNKTNQAGIISLTATDINTAKTAFLNFAAGVRLEAAAPGGLSNVGSMLNSSGLTGAQKETFKNLFFANPNGGAALWDSATGAGLPGVAVDALKVQGKLAYLTFNNAPLGSDVQKVIGTSGIGPGLIGNGLYKASVWTGRLNTLAGGNASALDALIPPAYTGDTPDKRRDAYSEDLARRVRLSFPTQVVAAEIVSGGVKLGDDSTHAALKDPVNRFLSNATTLGFELGRVPLDPFIAQHGAALFNGIPPGKKDATMQGVRRLQRLYQITLSNESLSVVFQLGFGSAREITAFPFTEFMDRFGDRFPSPAEAGLVYSKAQQVAAVTNNVFAAARLLDTTPDIFAISTNVKDRDAARDNLKKRFPTMKTLFGSMDFCECEHCRSVLSPAAYLVDLLKFLEPDQPGWDITLSEWKGRHDGAEYPFKGLSEQTARSSEIPDLKKKKPFEVLISRRPDLPHLPLTCENTNTALPYIDVVNEILEYYVANDHLDPNAVRDTGSATSEELLAEPQNVVATAYDDNHLKGARYPLRLPFDLWLETVRGFCVHFETPLSKVLEVFRTSDALFPPTLNPTPKPYYRFAVFAEYLGISPAEYAVFTEPSPQGNWNRLYGYATPGDALGALKSAKTLARRLGVSYKELIQIVRTGFVNPHLDALIVLRKLGVEVEDLLRYKEQPGFLAFSPQEKDAFEKRLTELAESMHITFDAAKAQLETASPAGAVGEILMLVDLDAGCDFDQTVLLYAAHKPALDANQEVHRNNAGLYGLAFLKINLFIRLWKKLGWTIEETDRALATFLPRRPPPGTNDSPISLDNIGSRLQTALVYLAHLKALDEKLKTGKNSRSKLLTIWANLSTKGQNPLYAQLFLTRSLLKNDPVFDDPLGNYLSQPSLFIDAHLLALQGALNLTADDIGHILDDAGMDRANARLSLENVSLLYRYGLLAKALKLTIPDLIAFKALSGLDPFKPLIANPLTELEDDYPFTQTLRFVEVAERVKESGFLIEDLEYLLRRRFDPVGKYRENPEALLALARRLAGDIGRLRDEHAVADNIDDGLLRQELGIVLSSDLLTSFLSAISGTSETEVTSDQDIDPDHKLDPKSFAGEQGIRVSYDDVLQTQRLAVRGLLLDAKRDRLKGATPPQWLTDLLDYAQESSFKSLVDQIAAVVAALTDSVEYRAIKTGVNPDNKLDPATLADETALRVSYDLESETQRLTCRGLLLDATKNRLIAANSSLVLGTLLDSVQSQARTDAAALIRASLGMLADSIEFESTEPNVQPEASLDPGKFERDASVSVEYDAVSAWEPSTEYNEGDIVSFNGQVWTAKRASRNVQPVEGLDWEAASGRTQRLVVRGLLSDERKNRLRDRVPSTTAARAVLSRLLDAAQAQSRAFVERLVSFAANDFKSTYQSIASINDAPEPRRSALMKACLPFILRKITRQLLVQTMASELSADPDLTEALLTDDRLLIDPQQPATPLLDGFTAVADPGVTASFFKSADASDVPLEKLVPSVDMTLKPDGDVTNSARFEGYIEAPATGPYRFFAKFGERNSEIEFSIGDSGSPLLQGTAANNGDEISAHIELKAGVPYHFLFHARTLGNGSAALLVQGEGLPKGSISRLKLYAASAVERLRRARTLLANSLQIISKLALSQREVTYLLTHASDFGGVDLSKLPVTDLPDSQAAIALFDQFLSLSDYVLLRSQIAGGTEDLISVFEHARQADPDPVEELSDQVAVITRREEAPVRGAAQHLGMTTADFFARARDLRRLWEALEVMQQFGVPVEEIAGATGIVDATKPQPQRFEIARNLRNTVKARYEPETWQRIAQPIFDKLRGKQRDALVAYIIHQKNFDSIEQLFEYFLIDPGMEPVVQTSRLRLAISSVQTFIQRCLLNLELWVDPSVINSAHWEWMKRYRVWEANRKIFLFPENWLEPEFRDDKTHLFQGLEGSLLQGDVSNDLAEDAFLTYLTSLEELARLEIVTIYHEEKPSATASSTLHVIGRTYSLPRKYFYRRYARGMWTPWEPVTAEIEGDHVVAMVWRERLHLFWVTFMEKADPKANDDKKPRDMADMKGSEIKPPIQVEVQLNWSEYFQGQWATRQSSGFSGPLGHLASFEARGVFIHAIRNMVGEEERSVAIAFDGVIGGNFIARGKNSPFSLPGVPSISPRGSEASGISLSSSNFDLLPYLVSGLEATRFQINSTLSVLFTEQQVISGPGRVPTSHPRDIVDNPDGKASIVRGSNLLQITANEINSLKSPFFYADSKQTFFVQPNLTETLIQHYDNWTVPPPEFDPTFVDPRFFDDLPLDQNVPFIDPDMPKAPDPFRLFDFKPSEDWLADPGTVLQFGEGFVGQTGAFQNFTPRTIGGGAPVTLSPGSIVLVNGADGASGALSVIGSAGLSRALLNNLIIRRESNQTGFSIGPGSTGLLPTF